MKQGHYYQFVSYYQYQKLSIYNNDLLMEKQFECTKIKDGLYLGNFIAAEDPEFLLTNKFAYVINCAAEIPNYFQQMGVKYLNFKLFKHKAHKFWQNPKTQAEKIAKIDHFIRKCQKSSLCCLIHSFDGTNRSLLILCSFIMIRFKWTVEKTLIFLKSKNLFIGLSANYLKQLQYLQEILSAFLKQEKKQTQPQIDKNESQKIHETFQYPKRIQLSNSWDDTYQSYEEQIVSKTYLNSLQNQQSQNDKKKYFKKQAQLQQQQPKKLQRNNFFKTKENKVQNKSIPIQQQTQFSRKKIKRVTWRFGNQKEQKSVIEKPQIAKQKMAKKNKGNLSSKQAKSEQLQPNIKNLDSQKYSKQGRRQSGQKMKQKMKEKMKKNNSNAELLKRNTESRRMKKREPRQKGLRKMVSQQQCEQIHSADQQGDQLKCAESQIMAIIKNKIASLRSKQKNTNIIEQNCSNRQLKVRNHPEQVFNVTINNFIQPNIKLGCKMNKAQQQNKRSGKGRSKQNTKTVKALSEKQTKRTQFGGGNRENAEGNINLIIQKQLLSAGSKQIQFPIEKR